MNEPRLARAHVDKQAERRGVQDGSAELHARLEIFELQNALLKDRPVPLETRISARSDELSEDIGDRKDARVKLTRQLFGVRRFDFALDLFALRLIENIGGRKAERAQNIRREFVAFRMNPSRVERIVPAGDLQKAGAKLIRRLAEPGDFLELFAALKGPMLVAMIADSLRHERIEAGNVAENRARRGVQIDSDLIDAQRDRVGKRVPERPEVDVVLEHRLPETFHVELQELVERILKAPPNRRGGAGALIDARKFFFRGGTGRVRRRPDVVHNDIRDVFVGEFLLDNSADEIGR